ncbi:MAG: diguanylate cyclase [Bacterioplanes sp.]|nr:diguanylate cyclase [Bacterioplanes sp.]
MSQSKRSTQVSERMAALQQRFLTTLPPKAKQISVCWQAIAAGQRSALKELIAVTHQLAGSCGTFGLTVLGEQARAVELMAVRIQAQEHQQDVSHLQSLIRTFCESINGLDTAMVAANTPAQETDVDNAQVWLVIQKQALSLELSHQLSAFGYQVTTFSDFNACQRALETHQPALIFASVRCGNDDESIFEQAEFLHLRREKHIPLLLFSAVDSFELRVQAVRHDVKAFYVSPLDIPLMLGRITHLMSEYSQRQGRVCIIDDDALLAERYALVLQTAGIDACVLTEPEDIIQDIVQYQPDLILMDLYMPRYTGPELAGVIRQYDALQSLPIVYLSSERNHIQQLQAMSFGADDFITKPISDAQLVKAVQVRLARSRELRNLIEKDSLTGLMKHSAIKEAAHVELERARRNRQIVSVVMLDIDHFKQVNDRYGHAIGDLVITTLATLLKQRIRRTDLAGRYGGEEFVVILPDCTLDNARQMMVAILMGFRDIAFHAEGTDFHCTFSAGIAMYGPHTQGDAELLLKQADEAMYLAKTKGRNQIVIADSALD